METSNLTRGKYDTKEPINNHSVAALLGYPVRCNNQIHDFQSKAIKVYVDEVTKEWVKVKHRGIEHPVYTSSRKIGAFKKTFLKFGKR